MPRGPRQCPAPVGVIARTEAAAREVIRTLNLVGARALSTHANVGSIEGMRLAAVIIDPSAFPLPKQHEAVLRCNLLRTPGSTGMYQLQPC